jgi:hypothetical protein
MLAAVLSLAAAGAASAVMTAAGARLCAAGRLGLDRDLRAPVHFLLGAGTLAVLLTAVGLAGGLSRAVAIGVLGVLALAGRWRRWRWPRWPLVLLLAVPLLLLLPVALAPPFFYDALIYHLGLPWQALLEGGLKPHPENFYATVPPLAQLVAVPALAVHLERVPALLHMVSFLAAGCAVAALARAVGAPRWAATGAGACLPVLPLLVVVPAFPAAEGWGIAGVAAAAAVALRRRLPAGGGVLVGALAGLAAASRAQVVGLAAVVVLLTVLRQGTWGARLGTVASLLLAAAPWWLKNYVLLGAPLAPLGWSTGGQQALWQDGRVAVALAATPAQAWNIFFSGLWPDAWYVVALLLMAFLLVGRGGVPGQGRLVLLIAVGLVAWAAVAAVPRYLGATTALLLALGAAVSGSTRAGRWAFVAVVATTAAQGLAGSWSLVMGLGGVGLASEEPTAVRARLVINDPFPAFAQAAQLPAQARVLFVGEPRGFGFPRPFVAPSYYDSSPLAAVTEREEDPAEVAAWLAGQGFTHLLINWQELRRLAPGYPVVPWRSEAGRETFRALLAQLSPPVMAVAGVEVYTLDR